MKHSIIASNVARIAELNTQIKVLADEMESLKNELKEDLEAGSYEIQYGNEKFLISLDFCVNTSVDKSKLVKEFGVEWLEKYMKSTPYQKLTIKKVA